MKFNTLLIAIIVLLSAAPALAQQSVVEKYRSRYPTPMSKAQLLALERSVAADVHGGLLVKPDGNSCGGYACDIICRSDSELYDILGSQETSATPQWILTTNPRGYRCELVAPAPSDPPTSNGQNLSELEQRLVQLEARVSALEHQAPTPPPTPAPSDVAADVKRIRQILEAAAARFGLR